MSLSLPSLRPKASLRSAQQRTITRLYEQPAVQAVLGMVAGKTASALTAFAEMKADDEAFDMFVVIIVTRSSAMRRISSSLIAFGSCSMPASSNTKSFAVRKTSARSQSSPKRAVEMRAYSEA